MSAPISAMAAARRMCERSDWQLSNLQLQKMLYLAQMMYLGKTGERLLNGTFEAWDYGPVLPQVYGEVKAFGSRPIGFLLTHANAPESGRTEMLDEAVDELSKMSAGQLVNITHWTGGAWARNYSPNQRRVVIPDEHIIDEFKARVRAKAE